MTEVSLSRDWLKNIQNIDRILNWLDSFVGRDNWKYKNEVLLFNCKEDAEMFILTFGR